MIQAGNKTVSKGNFKTKMFEYLRMIEQSGESLMITDRGIPTIMITPIKQKISVDELFADVRGKVTIPDTINDSEQAEWNDLA